ncbi:MAG TPA: metal ABC transporter permease, partial [Planctomycetota bacterium]|nr:metal ABC transporter permease [Planctomycetota bacterium]
MLEMLPILQWAFLACLILIGIHCYLGLHIVSRGVIFVDLALAQIAALGSAVSLLMGYELNSQTTYIISLGFAFFG